MIEAAVFDFDGVLADTMPDIAASVRATARRYGLPEPDDAAVQRAVGWGARYLLQQTVPISDAARFEEALAYYKSYYHAHPCDATVLFAGVSDMLTSFRDRGVPMSIVSNKPEAITRRITVCLGIARHFTCILGPESVRRMKPDPEGLLLCADRMRAETGRALPAAHCLMAGDSFTDIQAGKAAGFGYTCGVLYGYGSKEKLLAERPVYLAARAAEIAAGPAADPHAAAGPLP